MLPIKNIPAPRNTAPTGAFGGGVGTVGAVAGTGAGLGSTGGNGVGVVVGVGIGICAPAAGGKLGATLTQAANAASATISARRTTLTDAVVCLSRHR